MAKAKVEKKLSFDEMVASLNEKYAGNQDEDTFVLPTGSLSLDIILNGGLRSKRITELIAWEGAGKTTFCLHLVAEAQRKGIKASYVDSEHALDKTYATSIGVDWEALKPTIFQPNNGEEAFEYGKALMETGELGLLIFDSTSGMLPKKMMEGEAGDSALGLHSRLFSAELPKINNAAARGNTVVVFVSQIREKIGVMFGSPETTQAGNALKFWASTRIDIRKRLDKVGEDVVGITSKFKTIKNKTASPFQEAEVSIIFGVGYDKIQETIDIAVERDIINKSGSWFAYDGNKIGQGETAVRTLLEDNPELYEEIRAKVLATIPANTAPPVINMEERA